MPSVSTIGSSKRRCHNSLRLRELVGPLARSRRRHDRAPANVRAIWFPYWRNAHGGPISASRYKLRLDPNLRRNIFGSDLLMVFRAEKRSIRMATQIVMDHTGDTRHYFDADDTEALLKA